MIQHLAAVVPHQKLTLPVTAVEEDGSTTLLDMFVEGKNDGDGVRVLDLHVAEGAPDLPAAEMEPMPATEPAPASEPSEPPAPAATDPDPAASASADTQPPANGDTTLDDPFDLGDDGEDDGGEKQPSE